VPLPNEANSSWWASSPTGTTADDALSVYLRAVHGDVSDHQARFSEC
jgi:hypothetical protein